MAIDKKRRRPCYSPLTAGGHVGTDAVEIAMCVEGLAELCCIQSKLPRIVHQMAVFKFPVVGKHRGIQRPELSLCRSSFSSLSSQEGVRMFVCERKMPEHEPKIMTELTLQGLNCLDRVSAKRAFEVAVFYQSDRSRSFPLHVIVRRDDEWRLMSA